MRESASTDPWEPQGSNPLGPPGPELRVRQLPEEYPSPRRAPAALDRPHSRFANQRNATQPQMQTSGLLPKNWSSRNGSLRVD